MENLYKWVNKSRGDDLPINAIYAGSTSIDGDVYVGRFRNTPGKVNLQNGEKKIWNFWVQNLGNQLDGEVLTTTHTYKWVSINRDNEIPKNAVYSGYDNSNDKVWVGRSKNGEPGKINCNNNNSTTPLMWNLWCHSKWSAEQSADILVIHENIEVIDDSYKQYETDEEKKEEIKIKNEQNKFLHYTKNEIEEMPRWNYIDINKISKIIKNSELDVEIGHIIKSLFQIISAANGDIISLIDLTKRVKLHVISSSSNELTTKNEIIVSKPNDNGFKKYILLYFTKQEISKSRKILGIFNTNQSYVDLKIDTLIIEPSNNPSLLICNKLINENANAMIDMFSSRIKNT